MITSHRLSLEEAELAVDAALAKAAELAVGSVVCVCDAAGWPITAAPAAVMATSAVTRPRYPPRLRVNAKAASMSTTTTATTTRPGPRHAPRATTTGIASTR